MPGIVGLVAPGQRESIERNLARMAEPLLYQPWYTTQQVTSGDAGIAALGPADRPAIASDERYLLAVAGEIAEQNRLVDQRHAREQECDTLSALLLRAYRRGGTERLCGLNGIYVVVVWDTVARKLTIVSDRYGFGKLFYWHTPHGLVFASACKAIARHEGFTRRSDPLALADLLTVSYPLEQRTLLADVYATPAAARLEYQGGTLTLRRYWDYTFPRDDRSDQDLAEEYFARTRTAVLRRAPARVWLPITGGLDSRTIAGVLHRFAPTTRVSTSTIGHDHCADVRYSQAIARVLGYPHTFVPVGPDYLQRYAATCVWRLEGNASTYTAWIFAQNDLIEASGVDATLNGFLGGTLTGSNFSRHVSASTPPAPALQLFYRSLFNNAFNDSELAQVLRPEIYRSVRGAAFNSIKRAWHATPSDATLDRCIYVDLHQRQRRFISTHLDVLGSVTRVLDPFADNDLVEFALGMPRQRLRAIYKRMIATYLPEVARVPYTNTGAPIGSRFERPAFYLTTLTNKVLPRLTGGRIGHDYSAYVHYDDWMRRDARAFVSDTLVEQELLDEHCDPRAVRRIVDDHMQGRRNNAIKLCALLTIALWNKHVIQEVPVDL